MSKKPWEDKVSDEELEEVVDADFLDDEDEFEELQGTKLAVQYAVAYLYEHREDADHHQLVMDLRSLLFGVRKPEF